MPGMTWIIKRTDTFLESFARVRDNKTVIAELAKKIRRLQEDPLHVGGWLSGSLHGKKSTRIAKRYRLVFLPDEREHVVYLILIDHRKHAYD
jgi:mRNA-degrading endonuclease RelE of RelBE toxin-antitoxin system